ncbi:MAG TPA: pentapeptide repeat-containing protein [Candidatus Elarobacter sp.]|jgi:hypothetical protein
MFVRRLAPAALALALLVPAAPARAEDDLVRQLVNACVGCRFPKDLHGRDLHGLRFVGADLRGADFSRANLNGASFTGADLQDARFDDADLRNVRFTGVRFRNTSFARAKLDNIVMEGVQLDARAIVGADYTRFLRSCTGCDLSGMSMSRVERRLREVERTLRDHPPAMSADVQRTLRELQARRFELDFGCPRRFEIPAVPAIPPIPPIPALPAVPPATVVPPGAPAVPPVPAVPPAAPVPPAPPAPW